MSEMSKDLVNASLFDRSKELEQEAISLRADLLGQHSMLGQQQQMIEELQAQLIAQTSQLGSASHAGNLLRDRCHGASTAAGWWTDLKTGEPIIQRPHVFGEKLALIHSEISEAMEGHRKNLMDDKLTHRKMVEVELADAVIRIADLAGALGLDLGGAIEEKMAYNAVRHDHKPEARMAEGGKAY